MICIVLLCSSALATDLQITVQDSIDNTTIPHATVFVNGANFAKTSNFGQAILTHDGLNDQLIRVSLAGYDDWEQNVGKNETTLLINLSRKNLSLNVNLYDSDTLAPVANAWVNISAKNVSDGKMTDAAGAAIFAVKSFNLYFVDIKAPGYQARSETVDMGAEDNEVQYWLLSGNRFSIVVKDKETSLPVPDAEVRIDTTLAGRTDPRGILITSVTRGKASTFEIIKPGYQTVSESRTISESDAIYSVAISKAAVGAFIYVFDEKKAALNGADIYFNGTLTGSTNEYGRSNFPSLVSGAYLVEVRKSGFVPVSRTIVISDQPADHSFDLSFENAALSVFVMDKDQKIVPDATVAINGADIGNTDHRGQLVTPVKFNTPLNITVSKEGYAPAMVMEEIIQGNATASVNMTLEKNLDWGLITIIGAGVIIVLILFMAIRKIGGRKRRHILRRDEI